MTALPRSEFLVTEHYNYLNHAAVGVIPKSSLAAIDAFTRGQAEGGVMGVYRTEARMPEFRARIGQFIGAGGDEIAILRSTTEGANVICLGQQWQPGDEVILTNNEFPANAIPWLGLRRLGVNVKFIEAQARMTPDVLRAAMTPRTKVVAVSWVSFADGYRHDLAALAEIAHKSGALFCVDGAQACGAFPIDVKAINVDVFFSGGQKWMLSLQGVSFFYLRKELLETFTLGAPGWRSMNDMWDFLNYEQPMIGNASRFEGGTPNFLGALSLSGAIEVLESAGKGNIANHVLTLTDHLVEGLHKAGATVKSPRGEGISSSIVLFEMPGKDSVALGKHLQSQGIVTTHRANGIRVSPHGYNTTEEMDDLLAALRQAQGDSF